MRAYTELEADGLIETRAGSAARVRSGQRLPDAVRRPASILIATAREEGLSMADTIQAIQALWMARGDDPDSPSAGGGVQLAPVDGLSRQ